MILDIVLAKIFTGLAIVSIMFCVVAAYEGNIDNFFYGLCGIVVFANLAKMYVTKLLRY